MTRTMRPFTVEVSRSRTRKVTAERPDDTATTRQPTQGLRAPAAGAPTFEHGMGESRRLAEAVFGARSAPPQEPARSPAPAAEDPFRSPLAEPVAPARPAPQVAQRVLPDLLSEDPMAVLLREREAEEAARRRRPAAQKSSEPVRAAPERKAKPAPKAKRQPVPTPPKARVAVPPAAPIVAASQAVMPARTGTEALALRLVRRREERLGATERFAPGERWKRRLPKSLR